MANQNKLLSDLLDKYEPEVANAFREAMANWRDAMDLKAFIAAISNNDIAGAIAALHLDPASLTPFLDKISQGFIEAGQRTAAGYPVLKSSRTNARFRILFNGRDPVAENWLRQNSATLISDVTFSQKSAIQTMLTASLAQGDNPTAVGLDLVGRVGADGKRQGGVIGLSNVQSDYLANAKAELRSDNSTLLRNYLTRQLRDKRFDGAVETAIKDGTKIADDVRTKMLVSYSNRMLKLRGDTIGLTETLPTLHAAQHEATRQAIATGEVDQSNVTKTWRSAHDARVRHSHMLLDGQTVAFNSPFLSPETGARMMYPGDATLGAPGSETIRCRCTAPIRIDFLAGVQ